MNLSLNELGKQYEQSVRIQKEIIEKNRAKLKKAQSECNFKEIKRLETLLRVLYDEKYELEEKAHRLKEYYSS